MKRKSLSYLIESELEKATVLLAAKSITDKLQQVAEQIAKMDANDVMPLGDSMRDIFGTEKATSFEKAVSEKLRALTEQFRDAKNAIAEQIDAIESGEPVSDMANTDTDDLFGGDDDATGDAAPAMDADADAMGDEQVQDEHSQDLDDVFGSADHTGAEGRLRKESVQKTKKVLETVSADHLLVKQFSKLLREGKSVAVAANLIAENYAMDVNAVVDIITKVKKG